MVDSTKCYAPFTDHPNVKLLLFGYNRGYTNWSLAEMHRQEDIQYCNNPEQYTIASRIAESFLRQEYLCNIQTFYAPRANFNGEVSHLDELTEQIRLPRSDAVLYRHPCERGSDGILVPQGTGAMLSSADCHTTLFYLPEKSGMPSRLIMAHCGRWAVINEDWAKQRTYPKRPYSEGVVQYALAMLGAENADRILVHIACGIHGKHFVHPIGHKTYGADNELLIDYVVEKWKDECFIHESLGDLSNGRLHMPNVIVAQCVLRGILANNITWDNVDTYGDIATRTHNTKAWCSKGRAQKHHNEKEGKKRNLVVVVHG